MFSLQHTITINNIEYEINTDYRKWLKFQSLISHSKNDEESFFKLLSFFNEIGINFHLKFFKEALEECINFFIGTPIKKISKNSSNNKKVFDFEKDEKYIYSAFLQEYNIDLYTIQNLHWHKFKSLLESLSDECQLIKIIQYRSINLSKIKDKNQKQFYSDMKERYSLNDDEFYEPDNIDEADELFKRQIRERFEQAKNLSIKKECNNE